MRLYPTVVIHYIVLYIHVGLHRQCLYSWRHILAVEDDVGAHSSRHVLGKLVTASFVYQKYEIVGCT